MALSPPRSELSDENLFACARQGDSAAFEILIDRYRDTMFAYSASMLGNREDAEDVVQEAFVRAFLARERFHPGGRWAPWLMRIVQNLCRDSIRRRSVRDASPLDPNRAATSESPEDHVLRVAGSSVLYENVRKLPEKFRVPLMMRFAHQRSYREIALSMGVPESTVTGRLAGALRILRRQCNGTEL